MQWKLLKTHNFDVVDEVGDCLPATSVVDIEVAENPRTDKESAEMIQ